MPPQMLEEETEMRKSQITKKIEEPFSRSTSQPLFQYGILRMESSSITWQRDNYMLNKLFPW